MGIELGVISSEVRGYLSLFGSESTSQTQQIGKQEERDDDDERDVAEELRRDFGPSDGDQIYWDHSSMDKGTEKLPWGFLRAEERMVHRRRVSPGRPRSPPPGASLRRRSAISRLTHGVVII